MVTLCFIFDGVYSNPKGLFGAQDMIETGYDKELDKDRL